jgi:hypothetical protein
VKKPAAEPIVELVSQLKMNCGLLKRKVLFPFAPVVGEYRRTHGGMVDDAGGTVLSVVGHACINFSVLKSLITFPLESKSSHLMGTAEPCFSIPEKLGALIVPAVVSGETKPTKVHGAEIGADVFEGTLSRPSVSTVVTKYVYAAQLTLVSVKVKGLGSGSGVPETVTVAYGG